MAPHDALDALVVGIERKKVNWVLDADIRDFFTSLDHSWLVKFLGHRIADKRVLRLIQKWLSGGVVEDGAWSASEGGSPQGATVSPLLANVYLHYVFVRVPGLHALLRDDQGRAFPAAAKDDLEANGGEAA